MVVRLGKGVVAALVVGVVLGAVARALMALVSLAAHGSSSFTWSGSAFIVLLFAAVMVPGGAVAGVTRSRARWLLPVAGALFLCLPAVGVAGEEIGSTDGLSAGRWLGLGVAGTAVFATIGLLPVLTVRLADGWDGRRRGASVPAPRAGDQPGAGAELPEHAARP